MPSGIRTARCDRVPWFGASPPAILPAILDEVAYRFNTLRVYVSWTTSQTTVVPVGCCAG